MIFLIVFVCLLNFLPANAVISQCTGLHVDFYIIPKNSSNVLATSSADLTVEKKDNNFNTMKLFNMTSEGDSLIVNNRSFSWGFDISYFYSYCNSSECNFDFPNGDGVISLSGTFLGQSFEATFLGDVYYYNGTISSINGGVFTEDSPCFQYYDPPVYYNNYTRPYKYCCNRWKMLPDPEPVNDTCLQFTSTTNVFKDNKTIAEMEYIYDFSKGTNVTINATKQLTLNYYKNFDFIQDLNLQGFKCNSANQLCSYWVNKTWDSRYLFTVYAQTDDESSIQFFVMTGVIEYRNGTILKNESSPFTPSDSCTYYTQQPINITNDYGNHDAGVTSTTNFCCSLWRSSVSTTTQMPTTPSASAKCLFYTLSVTVSFANGIISMFASTISVQSKAFVITPQYYDSHDNASTYDLFVTGSVNSYYCTGSGANMTNCTFPQYDGKVYQLAFLTSFAPAGFNLFKLQASNQRLTMPQINSANPCVPMASNYNKPTIPFTADATLCCNF